MRKKKSGFTLVELIIVIVIIGVLSALAYSRFKRATMHAKIREAAITLKHIWELEYLYYVEHGVPATEDMGYWAYYGIQWPQGWEFWQTRTDLLKSRLGLDDPTGTNKFYYVFQPGALLGAPSLVVHAIPKYSSHSLFSKKESDAQLVGAGVSLSIDNDGSIYIYGLPGTHYVSQL